MIFKRERTLNNKKFRTKTSFKSYGGDMKPEDEKQVYENLGHPEIDMGGKHEGYFEICDGEVVRVKDPEMKEGENEDSKPDKVTIVRNSKPVIVNENFAQEFTADANKEEGMDILELPSQVAEAKCILFEQELDKKLKEAIEDKIDRKSDFESGYPKHVHIPEIGGEEENNNDD